MSSNEFPYQETLLQWIWQELQFNTQSLRTTEDDSLKILNPGSLNTGAGPDFTDAVIRVGSLKIYGDVEIHIHPNHWNAHHHESSDSFNRVVLHVVYSAEASNRKPVFRPDGTTPPLLELKPHLTKPLHDLIETKKRNGIPCASNTLFLNQQAFEAQVKKAHKEYFSYKTDELMQFYESRLSVPNAWARMFTAGLFYTLGIPRNRQPMMQLHEEISSIDTEISSGKFIQTVTDTAFSGSMRQDWVHSGMRPASLPEKRIPQAASLYHAIHTASLSRFLDDTLSGWDHLMQNINEQYRPGVQMRTILRQTIYYPASYLLGEFLFSYSLRQNAYNAWLQSRGIVPDEVIKPFKSCGYSINGTVRKAGLAHQLKRFCRERNCHRCEVFKKAINP